MLKIILASVVSAYYHRNQKRKFTGEYYVVHPYRAAYMLYTHNMSELLVCVAILHDVIEDCKPNIKLLRFLFGNFVIDTVQTLSKNSTHYIGDIHDMLELQVIVKSSDVYDNLKDYILNEGGCSPDKAARYASFLELSRNILCRSYPVYANKLNTLAQLYYHRS